MIRCDILLTAIGLSLGGSSTVHIYTQTIHRTIQNKQYIEQHNNFGQHNNFIVADIIPKRRNERNQEQSVHHVIRPPPQTLTTRPKQFKLQHFGIHCSSS